MLHRLRDPHKRVPSERFGRATGSPLPHFVTRTLE